MTSKPYRFSKARCDPCSKDLDMIDVSFCEKNPVETLTKRKVLFRKLHENENFCSRKSKSSKLNIFLRYTPFSKSALPQTG